MNEVSPFVVKLRSTRPGGQQVYPNHDWVISVKHEPTGAYVEVPGNLVRSQHQGRQLAYEAIEYITGIKP